MERNRSLISKIIQIQISFPNPLPKSPQLNNKYPHYGINKTITFLETGTLSTFSKSRRDVRILEQLLFLSLKIREG